MRSIRFFSLFLASTSLIEFSYAQDTSSQDRDAYQTKGAYGAIGAATYDFENYGVDVKAGYSFNKYFGIEAQGILGLTTDSRLVSSIKTDAKIEHTVGAFVVARLPLSERVEIFARGGVHNTRYTFEITNFDSRPVEASNTGPAAGAGIQYNLNPKSSIRADYSYLSQHDEPFYSAIIDKKIETFSIGYVRNF